VELLGKNRANASYYLSRLIFDVKKSLPKLLATKKTQAQPKGEKKFRAPDNCSPPSSLKKPMIRPLAGLP